MTGAGGPYLIFFPREGVVSYVSVGVAPPFFTYGSWTKACQQFTMAIEVLNTGTQINETCSLINSDGDDS